MTYSNRTKEIRVTPSMKHNFVAFANEHGVSMGSVLREITVAYANGEYSPPPKSTVSASEPISYIPPAEHEAAVARARAEGTTLAEVLRAGIAERLDN